MSFRCDDDGRKDEYGDYETDGHGHVWMVKDRYGNKYAPRTIKTFHGTAVTWLVLNTIGDRHHTLMPNCFTNLSDAIPLWCQHDKRAEVCPAVELIQDDVAMYFKASIPDTVQGSFAIGMAAERRYQSVSVGFFPTKSHMRGELMVVESATLAELSLVEKGASPDAYFNVSTEIEQSLELKDLIQFLPTQSAMAKLQRRFDALEVALDV